MHVRSTRSCLQELMNQFPPTRKKDTHYAPMLAPAGPIPANAFLGFVLETGGRLNKRASTYLQQLATRKAGDGVGDQPSQAAARNLTFFRQRLGIRLRQLQSEAIRGAATRLNGFSLPARGISANPRLTDSDLRDVSVGRFV